MKVAVAGASGFVGKALIEDLKNHHQVVALSRSNKVSSDPRIEWCPCDLFSLLDAEKALRGVDVAIYLVHSMRPSAHLTQGSFADFDLIVADNFVRAAEKCGVKQIIYLGGMQPHTTSEASQHLHSRWEVEEVLKKSKISTTILRAAIILGAEGSSFHIMVRLVERLPVMVCPVWTQTQSQPISLKDIVRCLSYCVGRTEVYNKAFDVGGPEVVSYSTMMLKIAKLRGLKRRVLSVPLLTPTISSLWVCLVTGAPRSLVKPLILGLKSALLVKPESRLHIPGYEFSSVDRALQEALENFDNSKKPLAFQGTPSGPHVVRSVQRIVLPEGISAKDVAQKYLEFLPLMKPGFMFVEVTGNWIYFCWRFPFVKLLILEYSPGRSWDDRQLFYVRGGLLARKTMRGRLEFRTVFGGEYVIAAIHDFEPRMPWYLYRWTQALFHLFVMKKFAMYLNESTSIKTDYGRKGQSGMER